MTRVAFGSLFFTMAPAAGGTSYRPRLRHGQRRRQHRSRLVLLLAQAWKTAGERAAGTGSEVFGPGLATKPGQHRLSLRHDYTWEWSGPARLAPIWPRAPAVIISTGSRECMAAGSGVIVTFAPEPPIAGAWAIEEIEEGRFQNGKWIEGRRLDEDENHQGRHLRRPAAEFGIQRTRAQIVAPGRATKAMAALATILICRRADTDRRPRGRSAGRDRS
jgi:hypothetical protein